MKKKNYFFEMLKDVWKIWPWYIASVIATAAYLILDMVSRSTLGKVTDAAIAHASGFLPNLILMVSVVLAAAPFHSLSTYTKAYMSQHMMEHLRVRIGQKAASISLPALERRHSGDILNFLGDELRQLDGFVYYGMSVLTHVTTVLVGTSIFMFCIDSQLTLVLYGIALLVLPASIFLSRPIKNHQMQMRSMMGKAQTSAREGLQSLLVVKSFRLEDVMADRYWAALGRALHFDLRNKRVISLMISIGIALGLVPLIAMLILGGYRILQGTLTIGQLLSLSLLGKTFIDEVADAPSLLTYIQRARAACERIYGFLDEPDEPNGTVTTADTRQPVLEINDLQFAYPGRPKLFDGLSLRLDRGRTIALVGPSGCGKSTLIKLICGFEQPQCGTARIFGHTTSSWQLGNLRDNIALVSQESFLFQGTLRDNLLSARAGATDEELLSACDRADIGAFVRARGLDADVGELGKTLSGGERQRIAIARAMLKDAPLLLLDEPTSSLDATTELAVQKSLERLMKGRTTLIITHRLSSIRNTDCIYVMDRGRIVQRGTHEALVDTEGLYRLLYQQQLIESEAV